MICGLICNIGCTQYNPSLFPSYDVLNPGPEVLENPLGFIYFDDKAQEFKIEWKADAILDTSENYVIINDAMSQWIRELKDALRAERENK